MSVKIYSLSPLMSVASKTKTKMYTTVALGLLVVLSVLPTWASTTPGITSITTVIPVVSTQSNQDLSVLRAKLKERFSGVSKEVVSLVNGTTTPAESFHGSATVRTIDVSQGIVGMPANFGQDFFVDIENDPYRSYINRLAAYGVLDSSQKFYPQNYFRVNDFMGLLQKLYAKKTGQSLSSDVLSITSKDGIMTKRQLQQMLPLLKNVQSVDIDGNGYDRLIRSEGVYFLVRMFDLPTLDIDASNLGTTPDYFTDIIGHPFAPAINTLASLHIITTQTHTFYPDNYLRHYDFTVLFVNSLLSVKSTTISDVSVSSFADVESTASYLPQLTYAADRGLIDYLITSKRGQLYFEPDSFMTKHEIYQILSKILNIQFTYNPQQADVEKMTRAELSELLVESFGFEPKIITSENISSNGSGDNATLLNKLRVLLSMI